MKKDVSNLHRKIQQESTNGTVINKLCDIFKGGLEASVYKHIPHKVCERKDKLPWITQELKSLIRKRDRAYNKKKKSNHPQDTIQRKSRQAYWKYIEEIVTPENKEEVHSLPKRFWTYIKHKKKRATKVELHLYVRTVDLKLTLLTMQAF